MLVKRCPKCDHLNPENELSCEKCNEDIFLVTVEEVKDIKESSEEEPKTDTPVAKSDSKDVFKLFKKPDQQKKNVIIKQINPSAATDTSKNNSDGREGVFKYCSCGTRNAEDADFCSSCHTDISKVTPMTQSQHKKLIEKKISGIVNQNSTDAPASSGSLVSCIVSEDGFKIEIPNTKLSCGRNSSDKKLADYLKDKLAVSREHGFIWKDGEKAFIRDEGSSNGTYVNGRQIPAKTDIELHAGDELLLGHPDVKYKEVSAKFTVR